MDFIDDYYRDILTNLEANDQLRKLRKTEMLPGPYCLFNDKKMLNLSSNDYLGLAGDKILAQKFFQEINNHPALDHLFSSSSSRLLTGHTSFFEETESLLAKMYEREAALFFNSGYQANVGIIPTLMEKGDLILSDKLVHASLIDGIRLSHAEHIRFKHFDYDNLRKILSEKRHLYKKVIIVTESIFSMDGDVTDLKQLIEIKNQYNALLYVDEAHALGTRGKKGLGIVEEQNVLQDVDLIIGTMGKALASMGAFVICSQLIKDFLVNKMRGLIFSTALPPINMLWSLFLLSQIYRMTGKRENLRRNTSTIVGKFAAANIETPSQSNIIPIVTHDNGKAVRMSQRLQEMGFLVFAIRPPTVPPNQARIRLSVTANMDYCELDEFSYILIHLLSRG